MERVTLNEGEQKRAVVIPRVIEGSITAAQAAEALGLSVRQVRRVIAAYREGGVGRLAHGNRGRAPSTSIRVDVRERVLELAGGKYKGFNHSHLTEKLGECEQIKLSRSTVRRILLGELLQFGVVITAI